MINKDGLPTTSVSLRIESSFDKELEDLAGTFTKTDAEGKKWNKSDVMRHFLKIGFIMHHPNSVVPASVIIDALPKSALIRQETPIPVHTLIKAIVPLSVDKIMQAEIVEEKKEEKKG